MLSSEETLDSRDQMFALPLSPFLTPWCQVCILMTGWWELVMLGDWSLKITTSPTGIISQVSIEKHPRVESRQNSFVLRE